MSEPSVTLSLLPLQPGREDAIALMTLNRPDVSNAFNGAMIDEALAHLDRLEKTGGAVRALVVRGQGKHFSGGADLQWMRQSMALDYDANVREAERLSRLFSALGALPIPTMAIVHGAAFGGGVGLVACCDWAIAVEGARFCLSEVRVGLVAAVILPYLHQKMVPGELRRLVMTATVFDAAHAMRAGLVQRVTTAAELDAVVREELGMVLAGEPQIQRTFKKNHRRLLEGDSREWQTAWSDAVETIAKARVSKTGQAGIRAFLEKSTPDWAITLPEGWKLP